MQQAASILTLSSGGLHSGKKSLIAYYIFKCSNSTFLVFCRYHYKKLYISWIEFEMKYSFEKVRATIVTVHGLTIKHSAHNLISVSFYIFNN